MLAIQQNLTLLFKRVEWACMSEAINYIGIGVPLPAYRQEAADEARFWLDKLGMIGRDVKGLIEENAAVFAYNTNGERIGFMARTNTFPSVVTPGGKMVELGAMVKYGTANMNGVGRVMTQALVAIEQDIAQSDEQIAMATNPLSEQTFRGGGEHKICQATNYQKEFMENVQDVSFTKKQAEMEDDAVQLF